MTFGVPLALALREIAATPRGGGGWRPDPRPPAPPAPLPHRPSYGNKPLPDCLIPKLPPRPAAPVRVLENA